MKDNLIHVTNELPAAVLDTARLWETRQSGLSFNALTSVIVSTHQSLQDIAVRAVNRMATLRNWLIGFYIVEYEQRGEDRANYGDRLLQQLEAKVAVTGLNVTLFKYARRFYRLYPEIAELFRLPQVKAMAIQKGATATHQFSTPLRHG